MSQSSSRLTMWLRQVKKHYCSQSSQRCFLVSSFNTFFLYFLLEAITFSFHKIEIDQGAKITMRSSHRFCTLVLCLLGATSQAFTLNMAHNNPLQNNRMAFPNSASSTTSRTAVSTGAMDTSGESSLRSRVGYVIGGLKGRIRKRPNVEIVEDVSDFHSILRDSQEQLVAVFFHSPVCKACQTAAPHFYKLSQKYSNVKFLSVSLTKDNKTTLKELGVKKFPFGHIYDSQRGLLDELPILRKLIPRFEERLQSHVIARASFEPIPLVAESFDDEYCGIEEACAQ